MAEGRASNRRRATRLVAAAAALGLLHAGAAQAERQWHRGEVATGFLAICGSRADAETLLGKLAGNEAAAVRDYLDDADNSCTVGSYTFEVGDVVDPGKGAPAGDTLVIFGISTTDGTGGRGFAIAPSRVLAAMTSI